MQPGPARSSVSDDITRPGKRARRSSLGSKRMLPSGRWQVRVSCGFTRSGRQRTRSCTVDTEREADEAIARLAVEMGRDPASGDPMTLSAYYHGFFVPEREGRLANATMERYDGDWRRVIAPALGDRPMDAISHAEVQALVSSLSRPSAQHVAATLRAVLRGAWDDGLLAEEPMRHRLRLPADDGRQLGVWDAETVRLAMERLRGGKLEALWLVMAGGGLRREEALALFWGDLSFAPGVGGGVAARVLVDDALTEADGRKPVKTRYSRRTAPVGEPFSSRLEEIAGGPGEPVCALRPSSVSHAWRRLWDSGAMDGVPYLPLSRMRATHETLMQAAGVPDTLNARVHGRADASQVGYRHYLNPRPDAMDEAARRLGEAV